MSEEQKVSAQEILEVIFELNQSVPATHVGQSERVPNNCTNSTKHSVSASENTAHHIIQSDPAPEGNLNSTNEDASAMDDFNAGKWNNLKILSIFKVKAVSSKTQVTR